MRKALSKKSHQKYELSDHYDGVRFFNPGGYLKKEFNHVLKFWMGKPKKSTWPRKVKNSAVPNLGRELNPDQCYLTFINHSTFLIQLQNLNVLTDPVFSKKAGPFSLFGPKRVREPGLPLKKLPLIDVVVVSHNHYDHMDLKSLKKIDKLFKPLFIVPLGNRKYLESKRIHHIIELDWWESYEINQDQRITLVPAQHWSMRRMNDANKALWGGFWITSFESKIYFAGDTGYGTLFKEIFDKLGAPTISLLPIGSYEPRWFMKPQHLNPEEAVLASQDLQSKMSIAMHHQTFRLSYEGYHEPVQDLWQSLEKHQIPKESFLAPENGETIIIN